MIDLAPPPRRPRGESIVPMINVVFLLLVFFLMTSQLAPPEPVEVTPPAADAADDGAEAGPAALYLAADGTLAFRELRGEAAIAAFAAEAGPETSAPPALRADAQAEARDVAAILSRLRAAGLGEVALVVVPR